MRAPRHLLLLALLLAPALTARAEEPDKATAAARKAAADLRARLPEPTPAVSFDYEGDIMVGDLWAGELTLSARIARLGTQWVWRVTETTYLDWSGGEVREKIMLHLGRDLGILSGTYEHSDRDGAVTLGFARSAQGFDVERRRRTGEAWGKPERVVLPAAPGALGTLPSVMLFLRVVPPGKGPALALPWVGDPAWKAPEKADPQALLRLRCLGPATFEVGEHRLEAEAVEYLPDGAWDLYVSRDHRKLVGMKSIRNDVRIVPRGLGGERITADPSQPATTWKQGFLKFGFGYHMARTELLEEAFHWPLMHAHEVEIGRWSADKPLDEFRKAWVAEFVAGSKHRDVPETRRLLSMTLATGVVEKETESEVVFRAHPNFGGGTQRTYHLRKVDGVWALTRIDF